MTAPFELHGLLLAHGEMVTAFAGLAVSAIFRHLEVKARALDLRALDLQNAKGGAITAPSSLDEELVSADICERVERLLRRRGFVDPDRPPETRLERWYARAAELRAQLVTVDEDGRVTAGVRGKSRGTSTDPAVVTKILDHLDLSTEPPMLAPARGPPEP